MKKIILACAALASLAAAGSASAQPFRGDGDFGNFDRREARAERQIDWCVRADTISYREARQLRMQLAWIERIEDRASPYEVERRLDQVENQIRFECRTHVRYDRGDDYGYGHRGFGYDGRGDGGPHDGRGGRGGRGPVVLLP
jgi:hypothetical protein